LEGGLGYAMAVADTRHFLIAIMREHLKHLPDATRSLLEKYFDEQSGHGEDAAEHYALSFHSIGGVSYEKFSRFVELSRVHHSLLYRTSHSPSMVPGSHFANQQHMAFPFDYSILANTIVESFLKSSSFSSQLAMHWAPGIRRNIAESVAALIPSLRESPSNDLTATRPSSSPKLMHAVDPSCIVDVSKICVNSRRWDELRAMMGDDAQFKSVHQACAVELCARREKDLLVVLGTGEGKSLTFMLNAFRPEERGKATVVVLPLLSLQDDLEGRMKENGIKVLCWRPSTDARTELDGSIQVVLVIADAAAQPEFLDWLLRQLSHGRIARLTFDEAHTVVTEGHYRPLLQRLKPLRQAEVQMVALTATAPIIIVPEIMELLGLLPSTTLILRAITPRKEIIYSVFSKFGEQELYTSITGNKFSPQEYVEAIANVIDSKSKILIFCLARSTAESVAELLHGLCYHAKFTDTEKKATLWDFKKGDQRILVATSALGLGYHLDNIDVVIHLGTPRNIIDFIQQSGRAGRNGKPSHSVIFHDPSQSTNNSTCPSIGIESMKDFVEKNRCRRITLGEVDGVVDPLACHMLLPASLCDVCMQMVGIVPKVGVII
jgi:superfamily II DNA helicase RecQ